MADPLQPESETRPARSRRFQYGIAAVLVLQVVAAVWLGIWRGFGAAGVFCAGIIGGVLAVSVVSTVSRILSVEHRGRPEAAGDAATRLMAVAAILIGVGLLSMMVFAFARG
jgi:hypothetical protein